MIKFIINVMIILLRINRLILSFSSVQDCVCSEEGDWWSLSNDEIPDNEESDEEDDDGYFSMTKPSLYVI